MPLRDATVPATRNVGASLHDSVAQAMREFDGGGRDQVAGGNPAPSPGYNHSLESNGNVEVVRSVVSVAQCLLPG